MSRPFQLIPARGRKLGAADLLPACIQFQLIPARGRKHLDLSGLQIPNKFQLIPARGRKRLAVVVHAAGDAISTYPRKGTVSQYNHAQGTF